MKQRQHFTSHSACVCKGSTKLIQVFRQEYPLGKLDREQRAHQLLLHDDYMEA